MPRLARSGFKHLLAATEAQGETTDAFAAHARDVLLRDAEQRPDPSQMMNQYRFYSNSPTQVRLRSPEEFLVRTASKTGEWQLIDEMLLPKLQAGKNKAPYRQLDRYSTLYRTPDDEFLETAKAAMKERRRPIGYPVQDSAAELVVDAWADRGLSVDIRPMMMAELRRLSKGPNHHQMPPFVTNYLVAVQQQNENEREGLVTVLGDVAEIYLGRKEKRAEFVKKNRSMNSINWGSPSGQIYLYGNWIGQLLGREELFFPVLVHLGQFDDFVPVQNLKHYVQSGMSKLQQDPEKVAVFIADSPWLANLEEFRTLDLGVDLRSHGSALAQFLTEVGRRKKICSKLRETLAEDQNTSPTFGRGLLLVALDQKIDQKANRTTILAYLAEHLEPIQALDTKRQSELASLVSTLVPRDVLNDADLDESLTPVKNWLASNKGNVSKQVLKVLREAKKLEELGIQSYQVDEYMATAIGERIATDRETSIEIFFHVIRLVKEAQRRGQWNRHYGYGRSNAGHLLSSLMNRNQDHGLARLSFLVDVIRNDKGVVIEFGSSGQHQIRQIVRNAYEKRAKGENNKRLPAAEAVRRLYADLGKELGDRPSSLFIDAYYEILLQTLNNDADREKVANWAKEQIQGGEYPALAADLYAAVRLIQQDRQNRARSGDPSPPRRNLQPHHQHLFDLITDDELPTTWRMHVAEFIASREPKRMPLELATAVVGIHSKALDADVPIDSNENRRTIEVVFSLQEEPQAEELLRAWREKWAHRYLRPVVWNNRNRYGDSLHSLSNGQLICRALELYLASADEKRVSQLLRKYDQQLGSQTLALALLVRAEKTGLAAKFYRQHAATLSLNWPNVAPAHYDADADRTLTPFLQELPRADERFFAEVLLKSMPDAKVGGSDEEKHSEAKESAGSAVELPGREERLREAAERLSGIQFRNDQSLKTRSLILLSQTPALAELVREPVAEQYAKTNLFLIDLNRDRNQWTIASRLASCHFRNRLRAGDPKPLVETVDKLVARSDEHDHQLAEQIRPFVEACYDSLQNDGENWTQTQCATVGNSIRGVLKGKQNMHLNYFRKYNTVLLVTHARSGEVDKLKKWKEALSRNCQNRVKHGRTENDLWAFGANLFEEPGEENLDQRLLWARHAMQIASDQDWLQYYDEKQLFSRAVKSEFFRKEELYRRGSAIVDRFRDGYIPTAALAHWMLNEKQHDQSAALWKQVLDATADSKKLERQRNTWKLRLARSLASSGQTDEAESTLAELGNVKWRGSDKKLYGSPQKKCYTDMDWDS